MLNSNYLAWNARKDLLLRSQLKERVRMGSKFELRIDSGFGRIEETIPKPFRNHSSMSARIRWFVKMDLFSKIKTNNLRVEPLLMSHLKWFINRPGDRWAKDNRSLDNHPQSGVPDWGLNFNPKFSNFYFNLKFQSLKCFSQFTSLANRKAHLKQCPCRLKRMARISSFSNSKVSNPKFPNI